MPILSDGIRGLNAYIKGVGWLRRHPRYLFFLFIPLVCGIGIFAALWDVFLSYEETVIGWILFEPGEGFFSNLLFYICKFFVYLGLLGVSLLSCLLFTNVLSAPVYEWVSIAVEKDLTGSVREVGVWEAICLIPEEIKKVFFILVISIVLLLIPGLNVLSIFVTAFLVGWDFYDYPLVRRGVRFRQRLEFVSKDMWAVMGFGMWLVIPFVQFFMMPLAVAGGTILNIQSLQRRPIEGSK